MTREKRSLLVINPAAGHGKGRKGTDSLAARLRSIFGAVDVFESKFGGHLLNIGKEMDLEPYGRILTVGGDGTPFELINGIVLGGLSLERFDIGMIPAGTGNSFLRDFMTPDRESALAGIERGHIRRIDTGEFSFNTPDGTRRRRFINILGIGLIADILKLTNEKLKGFGSLGYSLAVLAQLFRGLNNQMTVTLDGKQHEFRNSALVISNSKFTGGGMKIAPMARPDDGWLDVVVFREVTRRDIVSIFSKVFSGRHIRHANVEVFRAREIDIDAQPRQFLMADGELLGETPLSLKINAAELNVLL